jgi:hypothetical protein
LTPCSSRRRHRRRSRYELAGRACDHSLARTYDSLIFETLETLEISKSNAHVLSSKTTGTLPERHDVAGRPVRGERTFPSSFATSALTLAALARVQVTQCPIGPNVTYTYAFPITGEDQYGTFVRSLRALHPLSRR